MVGTGAACSVFELTKWYADAVSADGDFWLGYCAHLRCGRFSIPYSSVLDAAGQRHSLTGWQPDLSRASEIRWVAPSLAIDARWRRGPTEIHRRLLEGKHGIVDWRCLVPGSAASTCAVAGLGYVECLRLTIPPWRLPIRKLRWGRFLSSRHSLIWIDWQGEVSIRLVFQNGHEAVPIRLDDDEILLGDGTRATFDRGLTIRHGALGATVLDAIPGLRRVAPARIFQVEERKWRSRSTLTVPGEDADYGWSIHEVVEWP